MPARRLFPASIVAAALAAWFPLGSAIAKGGATSVDVELVLAVDISYSMDEEEQRLQREGYIEALQSDEFQKALKAGPNGRIAVAYMEWASSYDQRTVVNWTVIDSPQTARSFATQLSGAPYRRASRTSISGAANSRRRCRQPPQGVTSASPSPTTTISAMTRSPAATMAEMAPASAQMPRGNEAFSTLQPAKIRPEAARKAAPTR